MRGFQLCPGFILQRFKSAAVDSSFVLAQFDNISVLGSEMKIYSGVSDMGFSLKVCIYVG